MKSLVEMKALFFDRAAVTRHVDKVQQAGLRRIGARIRLVSRGSIKKAPKKSRGNRSGKPPYSRVGLLKKLILFAYDPQTESVIAGPAKLEGTTMYGSMTVPELLEKGGTVRLPDGLVMYDPHPYMQPAFDATLPQVPKIMQEAANSVR